MDFLDNAVEKIGEAFGVVTATTEKAINVGKKKYNIAALENKLKKCYIKLGKEYFEILNSAEDIEPKNKEKLDEIKNLLNEIELAKAEIEKMK